MFGKFFSIDSPFVRFLEKVAELMTLNLLFLVCSVPVITMGAAITAMYDVLSKMDTSREVPATKGFLKSFKSNFKKATKLWLIFLAVTIILLVDIYIVNNFTMTSSNIQVALHVFFFLGLAFWIIVGGYIFVLQARIEDSVGGIIKTAVALSFIHLIPTNLVTGMLSIVPLLLFFGSTRSFYQLFPVWILGGIAVLAYVNSMLYMRVLKKYVPELEDEEEEFELLEFEE